jgi:glycosyltransferase
VKRFKDTNADFLYGDGVLVNAYDTNKPVRNWIGGMYHLKVFCRGHGDCEN